MSYEFEADTGQSIRVDSIDEIEKRRDEVWWILVNKTNTFDLGWVSDWVSGAQIITTELSKKGWRFSADMGNDRVWCESRSLKQLCRNIKRAVIRGALRIQLHNENMEAATEAVRNEKRSGRCATCKHWGGEFDVLGMAACGGMKHMSSVTLGGKFADNKCQVYLSDASDYAADATTRYDFGCMLWEASK